MFDPCGACRLRQDDSRRRNVTASPRRAGVVLTRSIRGRFQGRDVTIQWTSARRWGKRGVRTDDADTEGARGPHLPRRGGGGWGSECGGQFTDNTMTMGLAFSESRMMGTARHRGDRPGQGRGRHPTAVEAYDDVLRRGLRPRASATHAAFGRTRSRASRRAEGRPMTGSNLLALAREIGVQLTIETRPREQPDTALGRLKFTGGSSQRRPRSRGGTGVSPNGR